MGELFRISLALRATRENGCEMGGRLGSLRVLPIKEAVWYLEYSGRTLIRSSDCAHPCMCCLNTLFGIVDCACHRCCVVFQQRFRRARTFSACRQEIYAVRAESTRLQGLSFDEVGLDAYTWQTAVTVTVPVTVRQWNEHTHVLCSSMIACIDKVFQM